MSIGPLDGNIPIIDLGPRPREYDHRLTGAPDPSQVPPIERPNIGEVPAVPAQGGDGQATTVDTPSLRLFADNMSTLSDRVKEALEHLKPVDVKAGGFGEAYTMSTSVNTQRNDFEAVLGKLHEGLTDLHDSMAKLASDYDTTEEMNQMKSQDLQNAMSESQSDFTAMLSAQGDPAT